jgi:hypothetical protein
MSDLILREQTKKKAQFERKDAFYLANKGYIWKHLSRENKSRSCFFCQARYFAR